MDADRGEDRPPGFGQCQNARQILQRDADAHRAGYLIRVHQFDQLPARASIRSVARSSRTTPGSRC